MHLLNKFLNHVKIVKDSIQHYLTRQQPRDHHCLQKNMKTIQFIKPDWNSTFLNSTSILNSSKLEAP